MQEAEAELRGRIVAVETLVACMLARLAELSDRPDVVIRDVMANAEDMLRRARDEAPQNERGAAEFALAAFDGVSDAMLAHLTRRAPAAGSG